MSITTWNLATPIVLDRDSTYQYDELKSLYVNIKYNIVVQQVITVPSKYEANLPGLAHDYYGDQNYWRVILAVNGLIDPISDVVTGMSLVLPTADSVTAYLSRSSTYSLTSSPTITI